MADLYNLDAAIDTYTDQEGVDQIEDQDEWTDRDLDQDGNTNAEIPNVLLEAERLRKPQPGSPEASALDEANETEEDIWQQSGTSLKEAEQLLINLTYTRLRSAWWQECNSPELTPLDHDTVASVNEILQTISSDATTSDEELGHTFVERNSNIKSLFDSIRRIDAERLRFLLVDLLKRRLAKIEAHPLYMRTKTENMSDHEVAFLKEYGAAVERHLQTTVTDHFSLAVLKQLDAPEMIDEPNLDTFVFLKFLEDVTIDSTLHPSGSCIIARYERVQHLCLQGQVELI